MPQFIPQARFLYPENADVTRNLSLLGDTITQIRNQNRLAQVGAAAREGGLPAAAEAAFSAGMLPEALSINQMIEQQKNRAADEAWRRSQAETADKHFRMSHGIQAAQLKIAQDAAAISQSQNAMKLQLFRDILGGAAPVAIPPSPTAGGPPPAAASVAMPAAIVPPAAAPAAPGIGGIPRDELALSMLGYGDAARSMREARQSTPQAILDKTRATKSAEQAVETELGAPQAAEKAREAIQGISKAGNEALRLSGHEGLSSASGPIAGHPLMPTIREKSANFETDLSTLQTKVFVTSINRMRELSKTGGAVGSVTEKEMDKLANSWRNLSTRQGSGNLKSNLVSLARDFNDSMKNIADAYKTQYGKELKYEPLAIPDAKSGGKSTNWSWGP